MSPVKEPNFFSFDGTPQELDFKPDATVTHLKDYRALFKGLTEEKAVGEASPRYFHSPVAPARIDALLPGVRLVALLRQPVERAYSQYLAMMNAGAFAPRPFAEVFREKARDVAAWPEEPLGCYGFRLSCYHDALQRYYDRFPPERIRLYRFEEQSSVLEIKLPKRLKKTFELRVHFENLYKHSNFPTRVTIVRDGDGLTAETRRD